MELINGTPFALNAMQAMDKTGQPWLIVIAKASYSINSDNGRGPIIAEKQRGLLISDIFQAEPGLSTPYFESDFAYKKPVCDVVVKGSVYAPQGRAVTRIDAYLKVGPIHKSIRVHGERRWIRQLGGRWSLTDPQPFSSMPVTYGHAFGGLYTQQSIGTEDLTDFLVHPANPIGKGFARGKFLKLLEGQAAPNIESVDVPIRDPEQLYAPVSLGPIGRSWSPRVQYAGTYDQRWQEEQFPLLPADFDERFNQCAPPEQQMPFPKGGEEVLLHNLGPHGGALHFTLPDLTLPMVVLPKTRDPVTLTPQVDTLTIDADEGTFDLTWRAGMPLRRSLQEVHTVAAGSVCKRWWKSRVYGTQDCGCGGIETDVKDTLPVTVDLHLQAESP